MPPATGAAGGLDASLRPAAPGPAHDGLHVELKRRAYRSYRRRQAHALLGLIPPEGVRPLYARARAWAQDRGLHDGQDPMATLLRYSEEILPLPPFRVWLRDVLHRTDRHLAELGRGSDAVRPQEDSLPVEVRSVTVDGATWFATLSLFQAEGAWRGFLSFHRGSGTRMLRTAEIFREEGPEEIRHRFRSFDGPSLRAFLRSVRH